MEKFEYYYGMRNRGFSPWCQPKKGLIRREDCPENTKRKYYDIIVYNRLLTDQELDDYELDYMGRLSCRKEAL